MSNMLGFWSYVHADDGVDFGRIGQLARDIVAHYEAIRAEKIELFLDSDDLSWGDKWRSRIDESLSNVAFFVPVLTPRYFTSIECRRELQFFIDRTAKLGIEELILPILYIEVPELTNKESEDPLVQALQSSQWEDWRHLRFSNRDSSEYRTAVNKLATEVAARVDSVEATDIVAAAAEAEVELADSEAGLLDRFAALEEAAPRWQQSLEDIGTEVQVIGEVMRRAKSDIDKAESQGKGFAARLTLVRRVASELEEPVGRIEKSAREWTIDMNSIDSGVRALIERAPAEYETQPTEVLKLLGQIRGLALAAGQGLGSAEYLVQAIERTASMSKDLRPVLRRLRTSLRSMAEARGVVNEWLALIDETRLPVEGAPEARA